MAVSKTLYDPKLVTDLVSKVRGKSALAALSSQKPISFVGNKEVVFSMDSDVDIVAENGAKGVGGITATPVTIIPVKFEYGARVSNEFMYASEEEKVEIISAFNDGFSQKLSAGFDKAAMHGINPRTGTASAVVGTNNFDSKVTSTVEMSTADVSIEAAISAVETAGYDVTGIAISPATRNALASIRNDAGRVYPEFAFGGQPSSLGASQLAINSTVATGDVDDAIVGDFETMFKWGMGKEVTFEVIEYGNPDNSNAGDLKGHNQVYLRAEAYIGWAIFDGAAFTRVIPEE